MKIANKIKYSFILSTLIITPIACVVLYYQEKDFLKMQVIAELKSFIENRVQRIQAEISGDKKTALHLAHFSEIENLLKAKTSSPVSELKTQAEKKIALFLSTSPDLFSVLVLNAQGKVAAGFGWPEKQRQVFSQEEEEAFLKAQNGVYAEEAFKVDPEHEFELQIWAPVFDSETKQFLGEILIRKDGVFLDRIMTDWAGLGQGGEAYLMNPSGVLLTPSRLQARLSSSDRIFQPELSQVFLDCRRDLSIKASFAQPFQFGKVFGVAACIPSTGWFVIGEMDASEALASLKRLRFLLIAIFFAILTIAWVNSHYLSLIITQPVHELMNFAHAVGQGNLDYRITAITKDELGVLSTTFNQMARRLKEVTASRNQLNEAMMIREKAEIALRESEERFRAISVSAQDAILMMDPMGNISYWNPAAEKIFQYKASEVLGRNLHAVIAPEKHAAEFKNAFARFQLTGMGPVIGKTVEMNARRRNGEEFPIELSVSAVSLKGKWHSIGILRDYTEKKKTEESLRTSEQKFRNLVETMSDCIWEIDREGRYSYVSPRIRDLLGYPPEEVLGKTPMDFIPESGRTQYEAQFKKHFDSREPFSGLESYRLTKNGKKALIELNGTPFFSEHGEFLGFRGVARDLTANREREEQLRQAQKYEAMSTLAGGVAHDFNNILSIILANLRLCQTQGIDNAYLADKLNEIKIAGMRGRELSDKILRYSRMTKKEFKAVEVKPVLEEGMGLISAMATSSIQFEWEIQEGIGRIMGDPLEIQQVLLNLCTNAIHAVGEKGKVSVCVRSLELKEPDPGIPAGLGLGKYILILVQDNGHGMDEETLQHIFEPYFTTKEVGRGTGMGLSIVRGIVQSMRGEISVHSVMNEGTLFKVYLPVCD